MKELTFVRGFRDDLTLRTSFNTLAKTVFGISFEKWYEHGYWTNKYDPFSYVDGEVVVANVSVNQIDLLLEGRVKKALQIGTVMTHPDYRNRGLSKKLMNKVLQEYKGQYDVMYLFANDTVLDFYPKFGFVAIDEDQYTLSYKRAARNQQTLKKLDGAIAEDLQFIYDFVKQRIPVSYKCSTLHAEELFMFYCMYVFPNHIYFLEQEDVLVLCKQVANTLHVYDIISKKDVKIDEILNKISDETTERVIFYYTPEYKGLQFEVETYKKGDQLFVKSQSPINLPTKFMYPLTAHS